VLLAAALTAVLVAAPPAAPRLRLEVGWGLVDVSLRGRQPTHVETRGALHVGASVALWRSGRLALRPGHALTGQVLPGAAVLLAREHVDAELAPRAWLHLRAGLGWSQQVILDRGVLNGGLAGLTLSAGLGVDGARYGVALDASRAVFGALAFVQVDLALTVSF
jgi:hypothetical protein